MRAVAGKSSSAAPRQHHANSIDAIRNIVELEHARGAQAEIVQHFDTQPRAILR